nr:hypothetical protein CFP56_55813 [Quercus suber]
MGDGLGGTTNQSKAQIETAHRTTERKTARSDAGEVEEADRMNVSDMETAETEAQITPESRNKGSEINEVIIQNSKLSTCHFNSADFDAQVQEVDVALDNRASNVSLKKTTTPHDSAKNVDPILNATPLDSLNIVEPKSNIASHDSATNTATLSPSHIAPNQIIQEHAIHVTDSLPPPANKTARTWKRLARDNNMEAAIKQGPSVTKRNREEEMEILPELPSKKLQLRVRTVDFPKAQVLQQATQVLSTFQQSQRSIINNAAVTRSQNRVQWRPPPANCVKLNFDGAIFPELGKAGLGVVVHDCHGNAIASLSKQAPLPFAPVIVEAMAAARAITFAQELGLQEFMLEGDSAAVINTLQSTEPSLTSYGHLLDSAKSTLVTSKCIACTHIRRDGNKVAHNLAKHARHVRGLLVWVEDIPPHLHDVLFADPG